MVRRRDGFWAGLVATLCLAFAPLARADIVVNVDQGVSQPLPIAIPAFSGPGVAAQVSGVVSADLARSGLFRPPRSRDLQGGARGCERAAQLR